MLTFKGKVMINFILLILLLLSGIHLSYIEHKNRILVDAIQAAKQYKNELNVEYSELELEKSTLASHTRLREIATKDLNMTEPNSEQVKTIVIKHHEY